MLLSLIRAVGWACIVALVILSLVAGGERPHTGLPGQIEHVPTVVRQPFSDWDIRRQRRDLDWS
jgi:hypothetical protein